MNIPVAIGIDIGGTKIAGAMVDLERGSILSRHEIQTHREQGGARVLDRLYDLVRTVSATKVNYDAEILGVGIGVPELVDNAGNIQSNWNFDWNSSELFRRLSEFSPLKVESDARTSTLAECCFGHGVNYPSFLCITIGTGISSVFCLDGKVLRGANGFAIHFASSDIMALCQDCGSQTPFNLEALSSGRGMADTLQTRTGQVTDARRILEGGAGAEGDKLIAQSITALSSYIGQLINIFDPHAVIVRGGLGAAPAVFSKLEKETRRFIWAEKGRTVPIVSSTLGSDGGIIGAAAMFLKNSRSEVVSG